MRPARSLEEVRQMMEHLVGTETRLPVVEKMWKRRLHDLVVDLLKPRNLVVEGAAMDLRRPRLPVVEKVAPQIEVIVISLFALKLMLVKAAEGAPLL